MIALQITHIKDFMNTLFHKDCFDDFLVQEVTISTYNTFHIHGRLLKDLAICKALLFSNHSGKENPSFLPICLKAFRQGYKETPFSVPNKYRSIPSRRPSLNSSL